MPAATVGAAAAAGAGAAAAASPTSMVCARSRSPALTAIRRFSARRPLAAAMLAQAGRRQVTELATLRPRSGRAASPAAASPRNAEALGFYTLPRPVATSCCTAACPTRISSSSPCSAGSEWPLVAALGT